MIDQRALEFGITQAFCHFGPMDESKLRQVLGARCFETEPLAPVLAKMLKAKSVIYDKNTKLYNISEKFRDLQFCV